MIPWIDIGVNLSSNQFADDVAQVVARARSAGIVEQIVICPDLNDADAVIALAQRYQLYATVGVHPHYADTWQADSAAQLLHLLAHPRVVAVGECGLDYLRNLSTPAEQRRAFAAQLDIAGQAGKPLYLHCRDAHTDFIAMLREHRAGLRGAVLHCFTGDAAELDDCLGLDLYIGITGWLNDERRGLLLRELINRIPQDRLLLETDSPYLRPRDLVSAGKSRRNEPAYLPHIAALAAQCRGVSLDALSQQTCANARRLFGLPSVFEETQNVSS